MVLGYSIVEIPLHISLEYISKSKQCFVKITLLPNWGLMWGWYVLITLGHGQSPKPLFSMFIYILQGT